MSGKDESQDKSGRSGPPFVGNLRRLRQAAGLSQGALAQAAGLRERTLVRLEAGHNFPSVQTVRRLALALGVSPQELQGLPGHPAPVRALTSAAELLSGAQNLAPAGPLMKLPVKGRVRAGWPDQSAKRRAAFWRCPACGNCYNRDIPACPNDGSART